MAALTCKMCGGSLVLTGESNVCECEFCGTRQTVPTADNEKKTMLFNRANRLRINAEFDKASAVYENILTEFPEEAEAYWGLCLCAYGIEYVDDPATGEKKPTCHRTLPTSIMEDSNFEQACDYADLIARRVYREEAKAIDRIQRDILAIVENEEPYDVFICYKETAEDGGRTEDSVLAQEIYDALTGKGLKVFFSRISLEDKLGQQYEPYIYAALSSAKVMLAVGTQFEYYDAVWVKNEWMRFLAMMRTDRTKTLIPCYKGLDAYDMPKEFKQLQAQDMGKLGWLQDLAWGVMKLCGKGAVPATAATVQAAQAVAAGSPTANSLLQRASIFLEDSSWKEADEYAERALDIEPTSARAYLTKLLVELKLSKPELLAELSEPFLDNSLCQKVLRYAGEELAGRVRDWNQAIVDRIENAKKEKEDREKLTRETEERVREISKTYEEKGKFWNANQQIEEAKQYIMELEQNEGMIQLELANLRGLFSGAKRKELEAELQTIRKQREESQVNLHRLEEIINKPGEAQQEEPDMREMHYQIGRAYMQGALYTAAYMHLNQIRGYRDVDDLLKNDSDLLAMAAVVTERETKYRVGNHVTFGHYPQTIAGDDNTPIEWLVLARDGNKVLLLSRYGLDAEAYNNESTSITWEKCTLRMWLNGTFLDRAFTIQEQTGILLTDVDNSNMQSYSGWNSSGGNNTQDKVFLLSYAEANKYFDLTYDNNGNTKPRVAPTAYAIKQGAYISNSSKTADGMDAGWWWLRSPGYARKGTAVVHSGGFLDSYSVDNVLGCVRPALWINLESDISSS